MGVVAGRNPVASLLSMVLSLGSVSVIFVLLEAHFLAAVQLIVYAGAIMVLFLFVIMLLNLGHDYRPDLRVTLWLIAPVAAAGALFGILSRGLRAAGAPAGADSPVDAAVEEYGAIAAITGDSFAGTKGLQALIAKHITPAFVERVHVGGNLLDQVA